MSQNAIATVAVVQVWAVSQNGNLGLLKNKRQWCIAGSAPAIYLYHDVPEMDMGRVGSNFFGSFLWLGSVGFNDTVIRWVRRLRVFIFQQEILPELLHLKFHLWFVIIRIPKNR